MTLSMSTTGTAAPTTKEEALRVLQEKPNYALETFHNFSQELRGDRDVVL